MKLGAGFVIVCPSTQRILLSLRNDPDPMWCIFGGTLEKYETPMDCAKRELMEEAGFRDGVDYKIISDKAINVGHYHKFKYYTYMCTTDSEVTPTLNDEHIDYKWVTINDIPDHRHFGLQQLIHDPDAMRRLDEILHND